MKINKVERITDEKWINLYAAEHEEGESIGRWVYASRRSPNDDRSLPDAVIIVPILITEGEPNRLVMIREFRIPLNGYNYGFPAGLIEEGETIEGLAARELLEETGLDLICVKRVSPQLCSSAGLCDEIVQMVFVDARQRKGNQQLEPSEVIEVMLFDFDQVCRICDSPDLIVDAKAWTALYLYQQLGKLE